MAFCITGLNLILGPFGIASLSPSILPYSLEFNEMVFGCPEVCGSGERCHIVTFNAYIITKASRWGICRLEVERVKILWTLMAILVCVGT